MLLVLHQQIQASTLETGININLLIGIEILALFIGAASVIYVILKIRKKQKTIYLRIGATVKLIKMAKIHIDTVIEVSDKYLIMVIELWQQYDVNSVLVAYSELKLRNTPIPDEIFRELNKFCETNNI